MPKGRLTRKTSRQPLSGPTASMMSPPMMGPRALETPMTAPMMANALPRSCGGKSSWMKAVTAGTKMPPARPWTMRAATNCTSFCARPHARLARVKIARPVTKIHLWPMRSPTRPAGMSARPKARA